MATLSDGKTTNSGGNVNGVRLKGTNTNYSQNTGVSVKANNQTQTQKMTPTTDVNIQINAPNQYVYSVTNNSGGTIEYSWL